MSYLVLARKWRPQTFDELLGQEATVQTLKNAIRQDRVAHAFLFSGPRGVGKTSLARILAKALNCQNQDGPTTTPCGKCGPCVEIAAGNAVDVLEIDGASNTGVDNIRELRETVRYMPASCRTKIYIIDEVHMLSTSAFNALLKTLEEPPPHVLFIFATTEPHKVLATILSRCQRYDLHRVGSQALVSHLKKICEAEGIVIAEGALRVMAREAEGSVRDSLSLLDQVTNFGAEDLSEEEILRILGVVDRTLVSSISHSVLNGDGGTVLEDLSRADEAGHDIKQLAKELMRQFRNLVVVKLAKEPERLMDVSDKELSDLQEMAKDQSLDTLERIFDHLARINEELGKSSQPRLLLEITLIKMATTPPLVPMEELIARLEDLEQKLCSGHGNSNPTEQIEGTNTEPLFTGKPEAVQEDEEIGCAQGESNWDDFLAFTERKDTKLYALITAGEFAGRSGREWRLAFTPGNPLMEMLKDKSKAKRLHELMVECFGEGHRLIITEDSSLVAKQEKASPRRQEEERRKEAMADPVVQTLLENMGGEIEEVKVK